MTIRIRYAVLALAVAAAACDRTAPTGHNEEAAAAASPASRYSVERGAMDRLARRLARALADPSFRSQLKSELDRSPVAEGKLHFQHLLHASERRVLKEVAWLSGSSEGDVEADAREAIPLEIYFPVPAHRTGWRGGPELLVASAREDHEAPIAYDVAGRRQVLSPITPPEAPVLAVVPVESDFTDGSNVAPMECQDCGGGGTSGGTTSPPSGLYLTYSHFVQDFEGWLKGSPEFEFHILGQSGTTDSLKDYQCAGASAGGYYRFDQNELNWSGRALLFSQNQLNGYRTAHPNQNFRIVALEDDDTACAIKFDGSRFKNLITTLQTQYPNVTGSKDTANAIIRFVKRANALQKILTAAYSFITTQDDLIGNAIEDVVVGVSYPGANWVIKGESNVTKGWIKLEMR